MIDFAPYVRPPGREATWGSGDEERKIVEKRKEKIIFFEPGNS